MILKRFIALALALIMLTTTLQLTVMAAEIQLSEPEILTENSDINKDTEEGKNEEPTEDGEESGETIELTWEQLSSETLTSDLGDIIKTESAKATKYGSHKEKKYTYSDGSYFVSRRLEAESALFTDYTLDVIELNCESLSVRYYNENSGKWTKKDFITDSRLLYGMYFFTIDDEAELVICLPQAYKLQANDAVEVQAGQTGDLSVEPTETGWRLSILAPHTYSATVVDYFFLYSKGNLINWNGSQTEVNWAGYQFTGDNRWCYNGYYYTSPSSYIPSGDYYYHRLPAAYIACKLVPLGLESNVAKYMCVAMLDVMRDLQNEQGYFPTLSGSQWLLSDYYIGPGFFDTRFNTDLVLAFLEAYQNYGVQAFWTTIEDYMYYYMNYALRYHESVPLSDGWNGWLVYDYRGATGGLKTHTSLNHQVAQIILLEEVYRQTDNVLCRFIEEMMFRGIQGTEKMWYMADGNLQYAYFNGKAASDMTDYPTLTYDDIYELGQLYSQRLGYIPEVLQRLMASKKKWMDKNNITGYAGSYLQTKHAEYTGTVILS